MKVKYTTKCLDKVVIVKTYKLYKHSPYDKKGAKKYINNKVKILQKIRKGAK